MNKKVNRVGVSIRQFIAIVACLAAPALAEAATCVVGGTDFNVSKTLFNPNLADDETGWLDEDVSTTLNGLRGTLPDFENAYMIIHKLSSNKNVGV